MAKSKRTKAAKPKARPKEKKVKLRKLPPVLKLLPHQVEHIHEVILKNAQSDLIKMFGQPDKSYLDLHCVEWNPKEDFDWWKWGSFLINIQFRDKLATAFRFLEAEGLQHEIMSFDGCYNNRNVRGSTSLSVHAWAAAIDFNADTEPLGATGTHFSEEFILCFTDNGIYWGGNWIHRHDNMHFALVNG